MMARAPLLLSESMLFPYRDGLSFEQDIWMDQGRDAAFAGVLDHPPSSTWEIINPRMYETRKTPAVPLMPDIHPLVDKLYQPYDIGQIGQLDVQIMSKLFGGDQMKGVEDPVLNPGMDLARIRAFFVHPDWARHGLARQLYEACERAATAAGFDGFELMATLPGVPLYSALGFTGEEDVALPMSDGITLPLRRMTRRIAVGG